MKKCRRPKNNSTIEVIINNNKKTIIKRVIESMNLDKIKWREKIYVVNPI